MVYITWYILDVILLFNFLILYFMNKQKAIEAIREQIREYQNLLYENNKEAVEDITGKTYANGEELADEVNGWDFSGDDDLAFTDGLLTGLQIALDCLKSVK